MQAVLSRFSDEDFASSHVLSFFESPLMFCSDLDEQSTEKIKQVSSA